MIPGRGAVEGRRLDPIQAFYERHPYPPPVARLDSTALGDEEARRFAHHLVWPERPPGSVRAVLVAGCGTSQAVRYALRHPAARVVGIDVAATSVEHTRALAAHHGVSNLEAHTLRIEEVGRLEARFDLIVCTGVVHHLADPGVGLASLAGVLAPRGAVRLMVYARYGRAGVQLLQDYCRRLGIGTTPDELADLVATLREIPLDHPISRLLRASPDFADDDALADALLNPRERSYTVPELFELIDVAGLRFGRWERQAPYLPDRGSLSETPHAARVARLSTVEQYAAVELFRGTMVRHSVILFAADDPTSGVVDFTGGDVDRWVPLPAPTATAVQERLPPGAAAALINRAHGDRDLVAFVDRRGFQVFRAIDGRRTVAQVGLRSQELVERLWRHDLVAFDATGAVPDP